jgi:hypothetical protein
MVYKFCDFTPMRIKRIMNSQGMKALTLFSFDDGKLA